MATHSTILAWEIHEQRSLFPGCSPWDPRVRYDWATKQQSQQNPQSPRLQSKLAAVTSGLSGGGGVCGVGSRMLASSRGSGWSCWWAYFRDLPPRTTGGNVRSGDESEREYFSCKNCKENVRLPSSQLPRSLEWGGGTQWLRWTNEWLLAQASVPSVLYLESGRDIQQWLEGVQPFLLTSEGWACTSRHTLTGVCVCVSHSIMSDSLRPMDCSPPGSSVHGIFQARILEWDAIPFSRGSSQPRDQTRVSCIVDRFFAIWTTREAQQTYLLGIHPTLCRPTLFLMNSLCSTVNSKGCDQLVGRARLGRSRKASFDHRLRH